MYSDIVGNPRPASHTQAKSMQDCSRSGVEFCLHMKNVPGRVLSIKHAKRAPVKLALPRSVRKILSAFSFPENGK